MTARDIEDPEDNYTNGGEPVDPVTGEIRPEPEPPLPDGWSIEVEREVTARYRAEGSRFDLEKALDAATRHRRKQDQVLDAWWAWNTEFAYAALEAKRAKSEFERLQTAVAFRLRQRGERSAEFAKDRALLVPEIWKAQLGYRLAEARRDIADKHMFRLKAMHEDLRTQSADERAMHEAAGWSQRI